ncbi:amino acid ABC transporter permease [Photobacterium leiognathi]|uniref:amino acid ABC transporter permease n=1 Tax=Photobacterium leiognathi TaxID=553611 RepID=UPI0029822218|nr:amino acid ABC transporter permease [Photobacterium leiognathi]
MSSCSTAKKTSSQPTNRSAARFSLPQLKLLDYILLVIVGCFLGWLYYRSSIGINYHWQWHKAFDLVFTPGRNGELPYFFQGVISTIRLSLWGMVFAAVFGLLLALGRRSSLVFFRVPANAYIQLVRNIPPLVFVFIFYFFISSQLVPLLGLDDLFRNYHGHENRLQYFLFGDAQLWENLFSGILCIGLIAAAYIAEVIRSGIDAIAKGQWEAADSLGLSKWDRFHYVIFPQAIAGIVPALAGQFISIVKDSSIISLISIQEMTFVGSEIANSSGLIFEIWLLVGAVYLVLCLSLSLLFNKLEKRSLRHLS